MNSLFNKLKATLRKDTAAATLSEDTFASTTLLSAGLPGKPSALAYDPCQSLLAVGTFPGSIHVFGKNGFELRLDHPGDPGWVPQDPLSLVRANSTVESLNHHASKTSLPPALQHRSRSDSNVLAQPSISTVENDQESIPPPVPSKDNIIISTTTSHSHLSELEKNMSDSTPNLTVMTGSSPDQPAESVPLSPGSGSGTLIKHLSFKPATPILISLNGRDVLAVFDLSSKNPDEPTLTIAVPHGVTCVGTGGIGVSLAKWVFVGNVDGGVRVVDITAGSVSEYSIVQIPSSTTTSTTSSDSNNKKTTDGDYSTALATWMSSPVSTIVASPSSSTSLLIGYESGLILHYDVLTRSIQKQFEPLRVSSPLTCLSWRPDGNGFVAGYGSELGFWNFKSKEPYFRTIDDAPDTPPSGLSLLTKSSKKKKSKEDLSNPDLSTENERGAICKVEWTAAHSSDEEESHLYVMGGSLLNTSNTNASKESLKPLNGITVFQFGGFKDKDYKSPKNQSFLSIPSDMNDFIVVRYDSRSSIVVASNAGVSAYDMMRQFAPLLLPASLCFQSLPPISAMTFSTPLHIHLYPELFSLSDPDAPQPLYLAGGSVFHKVGSTMTKQLLVTAHEDQMIRLWCMADNGGLKYLHKLQLGLYVKTTQVEKVSIGSGGKWICVVAGPHVVFYRFISRVDFVRGAGAAPPHMVSTKNPLSESKNGKELESPAVESPDVMTPDTGEVADMMDALDATLGEILADSKEIKELSKQQRKKSSSQLSLTELNNSSNNGSNPLSNMPGQERKASQIPLPKSPEDLNVEMVKVKEENADRLGLYVDVAMNATQPGWRPCIHAVHLHLVKCIAVGFEGQLLVTGGDNGVLTMIDTRMGKVVYSTELVEIQTETPQPGVTHPPIGPSPIETMHFTTIPLGEDTTVRTRLIVATKGGSHYIFSINRDSDGTYPVTKSIYFKPQKFKSSPIVIETAPDPLTNSISPAAPPPSSSSSSSTSASASVPPIIKEWYVASISKKDIRIYLEPSTSRIAKLDSPTKILYAGVTFIQSQPLLIFLTLTSPTILNIYTFSSLSLLYSFSLTGPAPSFCEIRPDATLVLWGSSTGFRVLGLDAALKPYLELRPYDAMKTMNYTKALGLKMDRIKAKEIDELFGGKREEGPTSTSSTVEGSASGFGKTRDALAERGEKLERLEQKFGDLSDQSKDFVDTIKEYNERQKNKKWWQL